jgi:PAS domain S-box-containing protein
MVVRVVLSPAGRPVALWLLAAAGASLVVSDFAWNWLTISGTYLPGTWGDVGWVVQPLLLGLAVLHPSVRRLATTTERRDVELHTSGIILLGIALLVAPVLRGAHHFFPAFLDIDDSALSSVAMVGGGSLLAALVALRFVLLLRHARRLGDTATSALADRDRLLTDYQSRYRSLVEQLPAITLVLGLTADGRTIEAVYVSPQTEVMLGVGADEWYDDFPSIARRIHRDDVARVAEGLAAVAAGGSTPPLEFRFARADGDEIWLGDVGAVLTEDSAGRHVQTMLFDVSDAKRAQAEREAMELELRLGQKLEAVGELAAGIAHEINTPTQFVGDTVRFLRDAFDDLMTLQDTQSELHAAAEAGTVTPELLGRVTAAEQAADLEYLKDRVPGAFDRADEGISRVGAIVGAMREFGHPPTAEKTPVQLNDALKNTLVVAMNEYKYVSDVETDLGDLPRVVCNGGDINQVFLNLIVNAAHAIEERGPERGAIHIRTVVDGDDVVISVGDSGCGIPDDVAARIFDPFFTTKQVGRGTGQGLAITRALVVDRHGGTITFDTEVGHGTTFHVRLPIGVHVAPERLAA